MKYSIEKYTSNSKTKSEIEIPEEFRFLQKAFEEGYIDTLLIGMCANNTLLVGKIT